MPHASADRVRRKARPDGRPGWIRVDSVHQGDLNKVKGVYHVNAVDEIIQYQFTGCVDRISESLQLPVLERLVASFPFAVIECQAGAPPRVATVASIQSPV